ncbi:DUF2892 domain-containing protein [Leptospira barantonii]|uniref:DUF2892 domain-containing protein n=1 Tax=Leptospira barantonii TaxID=2023184 RepID=A0A2M9Z0A6_9LEPT|nr:YgaP-like transmembrane domain [Leptospira barantonii]PJZ57210.1 hypothetical protein CH367_10775 [Leptospira barantonii]TGM03815.1 DUF2892 domain-containing protein [Leptospira barantonii]
MRTWYLERTLFLIAGVFSLLGVTLGFFVSPWGFIINGLVGFNQILFALAGFCPMAFILGKLGIPSAAEVFGGKK